MKKKLLAQSVLSACVLHVALHMAVAQAATPNWTPTLLPTKSRGPSEAIRINLPKLPASVLERLVLELDDFDVTALVSRDGADAVFTPPTPLPYGPHQLRLVEYAADGSVIERGVWAIEIRKTASFREAEMRVASTLNVTQRIADNNLPANAPTKTQGNGAARLNGVVADGDWRVQGYMDILYNSQSNLMPRQKSELDGGQYLLRADAGLMSAAVGHQSINTDSMVMQAFNRRGVSVGVGHETDSASGQVFRLHTQDITGFQHGLGVSQPDNHVDGATVVGRPIGGNRDALVLSGTYLKGEGPSYTGAVGTGIVGDTTSTGGSAGSVVADSRLFERKLRLRGEYAISHYDFDGLNTGNSAEKDHAYSALSTYSPWQNKMSDSGQPMALQFGLENKKIGTFFKSPANPIGVSDRQGTRGFTGFNLGGFNMQASLGQERDNVNDLALLPRTETTQQLLTLTYTPTLTLAPQTDPSKPPALPWFGQPMFNLTYVNLDQEVTKSSTGLGAGPLHATRMITAMANFNYPTLMWGLSHTIGKDDDLSNVADDTTSHMTQLSLNMRAFENKLTFGPAVQWSTIRDRTQTSRDSETLTAILNLGYTFTPRVNTNLSYSVSRQQTDDGTVNARTNDLIGAVNWIVTPAQNNRPGFTLSLEGQHHDSDDRVNTANTVTNYQVFLKASLSWLPIF